MTKAAHSKFVSFLLRPLAAVWRKISFFIRKFKWSLIILCLGFGIFFVGFFVYIFSTLPPVDDMETLAAAQSSEIYDREGNLLYVIHGEENREVISFEEIPEYAIRAVMAMEDDQFYSHGGVDYAAILKAVCSELHVCSQARGGSTITQQYVKNTFLSSERTYIRKIKEIILARRLEKRFSKNEIMTMYLNRISFGSIFGIERAANAFFSKSAKDLTLTESAILAAIPKAPSYYSPYGDHQRASINLTGGEIIKMNIRSEQDLVDINPDFIDKGLLGKTYSFGSCAENAAPDTSAESETIDECRKIYVKGRTDFVLERMKSLGYITDEEYETGLKEAEAMVFHPFIEKIKAPHFVMYVQQLLGEKYGEDQIKKGGLRITTTLNSAFQDAAEEAVARYAPTNLERYNASNASLTALDPETGQILAMVGAANWDDEKDGKVNVALRPRLPGSSFKPIVYAAAFLQGYAPSTVLYDVQTKFGSWYEPQNFDGQFRGPVTMRNALAHSLNIPAVKAGHLAGIPNVIDLARKMGIQLNQPDDWYGLSLALGAGEARLLDMVTAYSVFANGGYKMDPVAILKVEDRNGNILEEYQGPRNRSMILDPQVAYLVNNTLSDPLARPEGFWRDRLTIPGQVNGAKTGTSNKEVKNVVFPLDAWTIGYTRRIAAGVWAGNNDGSHLNSRASGLDTAGRIWHDFMVEATKGNPREDFERPEGIKWVKVSSKTGKLPSKYTPPEDIETGVFASFSVPREYDTSYKIVDIDKVSGKLATEYTPEAAIEHKAFFEHHAILPDNPNWENAVRAWAKENNEDESPPTDYDDVHTAATMNSKPEIVILSPQTSAVVSAPSVGVWVNAEAKGGVSRVEYYWDGELADTAKKPPFKGTIALSSAVKEGTTHTIRAVVYDSLYRSNQSSVEVKVGKDTAPPTVEITYPADGVALPAGTSTTATVNAFDTNGDIKKVDFYLDGKLSHTAKTSPYTWQFIVPDQAGEHTLRATVYDPADNEKSTSITFTSKQSSGTVAVSSSKIIEPRSNEVFKEGAQIIIRAALDDEAQAGLKELSVFAKNKNKKTVEIASAQNSESVAPATYTFVWGSAPAGTYELFLKVVLKDGTIRFSERVPVVVR